jgi:hypothetical protein
MRTPSLARTMAGICIPVQPMQQHIDARFPDFDRFAESQFNYF